MNESILTKIAIFVLVIGFLSLFALYALAEPVFISQEQELTENELLSFKATVNDVYETGSGSVVVLSRTTEVSGFIDTSLPLSFIGQEVLVTGSMDGEWLNIQEIQSFGRN